MTPQVPEPLRALYVHVPFCPSICPYCDFHVLTRQKGQVGAYLARLEDEAAALAARYPFELDTVYLGGGTPSFLRDHELAALVGSVRRHLGWGASENTLEVNPGTVSPARAEHWRALGFDRASVGVQSLHDPTLRFLGRQHSAAQAREAVQTLLAAGFRVSGDLITAVPGQPLGDDIRELAALGVEHISAYTLTVEPSTEFARRGVTVRDEDERRGFALTARLLAELGFARYELSNYARPGAESRHNRAYWTLQPYAGLGPGAAGYYPPLGEGKGPAGRVLAPQSAGRVLAPQSAGRVLAVRRTNPHLHTWLTGEAGLNGDEGEGEPVYPHDFFTDALFMGLRLREGVSLPELSQRSGLDVARLYGDVIARLQGQGLLSHEGERLRATEDGLWVLNDVLREFLLRAAELEADATD